MKVTYLYPDMTLRRELFPAPEGPIMATNCPDMNLPLTPLTTCFPDPEIIRSN